MMGTTLRLTKGNRTFENAWLSLRPLTALVSAFSTPELNPSSSLSELIPPLASSLSSPSIKKASEIHMPGYVQEKREFTSSSSFRHLCESHRSSSDLMNSQHRLHGTSMSRLFATKEVSAVENDGNGVFGSMAIVAGLGERDDIVTSGREGHNMALKKESK